MSQSDYVLTITAHTIPLRLGRTYGTLLVDLDGVESVQDPIL